MPIPSIKNLTSTRFSGADIDEEAKNYLELFLRNEAVAVFTKGRFYGILEAKGVMLNLDKKIAACKVEKIALNTTSTIDEALETFEQTKAYALPVFSSDGFYGILYKDEIMKEVFQSSQLIMANYRVLVMKNKMLEQSLKRMENLLYSVSHDLKSPINNIRSLNELLQKTVENFDKETYALLEYIESCCIKAQEIVDELLKSREVAENAPQKINLNKTIEKFFPIYKSDAGKKGIAMNKDLSNQGVYITFREVDLNRVIDNLLSNAIKFTGNNGEITITTEMKDKKAILSITDTGIGIPSHLMPGIFDSQYLLGRQGTLGEKSTGLGLSIVKKILDENNCKIQVHSEEGKGTIVTLIFPTKP